MRLAASRYVKDRKRAAENGGQFRFSRERANDACSFMEKLPQQESYINGGFFVFRKGVFRYLSDDEGCILEQGPLQQLALDGQLMAFRHEGSWQCMDTYRDYLQLNEAWKAGRAPWATVTPPPTPRARRHKTRMVAEEV